MAKRKRNIRRQRNQFEISEVIDDQLLPTPEELIKYKEVDSELPKFIQSTAKKEQEFRHLMNKKSIRLSSREQIFQHGINYLGVVLAFLLGIGGLLYSRELLMSDKDIQGSIFGGATMLYLAYLFINIVSKNK